VATGKGSHGQKIWVGALSIGVSFVPGCSDQGGTSYTWTGRLEGEQKERAEQDGR
jgi:hypothetical protein